MLGGGEKVEHIGFTSTKLCMFNLVPWVVVVGVVGVGVWVWVCV